MGRGACCLVALSLAVMMTALGVAGCGGGRIGGRTASETLPSDVVVRVGRHSLTKAALEHWTAVEAVLTYGNPVTYVAPKGLPVPPDYTSCIEVAAAAAQASHVRAKPTTAQLRAACRQKYEAIQHHMLDLLITVYWVSEEAAAKRLTLSAKEVQDKLDRQFPTRAKLDEYLSRTGERLADARAIAEHVLLLEKLQWTVSPLRGHSGPESEQMANQVDLSIARLGEAMRRKWSPQTDCRVQYVVSECRQFSPR